jgi:hypothetical protein
MIINMTRSLSHLSFFYRVDSDKAHWRALQLERYATPNAMHSAGLA